MEDIIFNTKLRNHLLSIIRERYAEYCRREFEDEISYETLLDLKVFDLMYTTVGTYGQYELQVSYDANLEKMIITLKFNKKEVYRFEEDESLRDFYKELEDVNFDGYYSWAHDVIDVIDNENFAKLNLKAMEW